MVGNMQYWSYIAIKNDQYVYTYTHHAVANTFHKLYSKSSFGAMSRNFHHQANVSKHANLT